MNHADRPRARADPERGQATVEFALCLPIVALAMALILQMALIVRAQILTVEAAREGARAAARDHAAGAGERAARSTGGLDPARTTVEVQSPDPSTVTVTVRHRAATNVPLVGALVPEPTLSAAVSMRREPGGDP